MSGDGDVDTTDFNAMCDDLAAILKQPPEKVLREEVGRVLSKTIENTDAADADKIRQHSQQATASLQSASLYAPKNAGRRHLKGGRVLYNLSWRYPNQLWSAIQVKRAQDVARRLAARGLAKRSWLRIGQLLSVPVDAPAYVKKAIAMTGKIYSGDERATIARTDGGVTFTIENAQPTVNAINGDSALQRAIDGRTTFFVTNMEKGVFGSLETAAKKYPGVKING
jgi:hypothetical protein